MVLFLKSMGGGQVQGQRRKGRLVPLANDPSVKIEVIDIGDIGHMTTKFCTLSEYGQLVEMESELVEEPESPSSSIGGSIGGHKRSSVDSESSDHSHGERSDGGGEVRQRKRAKLDHLSQEEKAQHRKMMNRISAQSARDRQKALMQEQERTIKRQAAVEGKLRSENAALKKKTIKLTEENDVLKRRMSELEGRLGALEGKNSKIKPEVSRVRDDVDDESGPLKPAVLTDPLPKGLKDPHPSSSSPQTTPTATLTFLLLLLTFYRTLRVQNSLQNLSNFQKSSSEVSKMTLRPFLKREEVTEVVTIKKEPD